MVLRGAVECEPLIAALMPELDAFPSGPAVSTPHLSELEPGPRALSAGGGTFFQGFYWYDASPKDEIVWRLVAHHLEERALAVLRKERGLTYSPTGSFTRRGYGGQIQLSVRTDGSVSEVTDWYRAELTSLLADPHPKTTMAAAVREVRKSLEADNVRDGLAALRSETAPVELLDGINDVDLQASLQSLLVARRQFGTTTPESNIASLIVLGLFGAIVLAVLAVAIKKLFA